MLAPGLVKSLTTEIETNMLSVVTTILGHFGLHDEAAALPDLYCQETQWISLMLAGEMQSRIESVIVALSLADHLERIKRLVLVGLDLVGGKMGYPIGFWLRQWLGTNDLPATGWLPIKDWHAATKAVDAYYRNGVEFMGDPRVFLFDPLFAFGCDLSPKPVLWAMMEYVALSLASTLADEDDINLGDGELLLYAHDMTLNTIVWLLENERCQNLATLPTPHPVSKVEWLQGMIKYQLWELDLYEEMSPTQYVLNEQRVSMQDIEMFLNDMADDEQWMKDLFTHTFD